MSVSQRCVRCIMDTSDPDIEFDGQGVCSHCRRYDEAFKEIVDASMSGDRLEDLDAIARKIKGAGKSQEYDCVVGVSGGVDSTFVLMKAIDLGLRPLAVHFDSGWNSELAVDNIHRATNVLGVDLKTEVVNWAEMRDLQLAFLRAGVPNCDIPTDHAFPAVAFRNANKFGARFILSGSNLATESILPVAWGHRSGDLRHLKAIHREFGSVKLKTYPSLGMLKKDLWYPCARSIQTLKPLDYLPYNKAAAKTEIQERLGWRDYGGKHFESIFTRFFQGQYLVRKFGFDKRLAHASSLILSGQTLRDQALQEIEGRPPYDEELQRSDTGFVAKKLGIAADELERMMHIPGTPHSSYATGETMYRFAFKTRDALRRR